MIKLNVNGKQVNVEASADTPLLWVLRDDLQMTGTKYGCGMALCGACTVWINGAPTRACQTPVSAVVGQKITTIEDVASNPAGKAVQAAWTAASCCSKCRRSVRVSSGLRAPSAFRF